MRVFGMLVIEDEKVPPDEVHFVHKDEQGDWTITRIVNVKPPAGGEPE